MLDLVSAHNQNFKSEISAVGVALALQGSKTRHSFPANRTFFPLTFEILLKNVFL
jgi:hypothetical protein